MPDPESIPFQLVKLKTEDYFFKNENYSSKGPFPLATNLKYGYLENSQTILLQVTFSYKNGEWIFLLISVSAGFKVPEEYWKQLYNPSNKKLLLSRKQAIYFAGVLIDATHGVLLAKTESDVVGPIILPFIDIPLFILDDVVLVP